MKPDRVGLLFLLASSTVMGAEGPPQRLLIEPSLQTNLLATDNSHIGTSTPAAKDLILGVTPRLRVVGRGARLRVDADVSVQALHYTRGTLDDTAFARGRAAAAIELVERWVHLDVSAEADQSGADPFALQQGSSTSTSLDLTTRRYRLSPYVEHQWSPTLSMLARSDNLWTRRSGDAAAGLTRRDSLDQQNVVRFERRPVPLGVAFEVASQRSKYAEQDNSALNSDTARLIASYAVTPELIVGVSGGRERSRFGAQQDAESDSVYGPRVAWRPTERTDLNVVAEHRFFGWGGTLEAKHRSPFLAISARAERLPAAQPSSLLIGPVGGNLASLLDAAFTTRYPDPAQRDAVVRDLIASRNLPATISGPIDVFPNYVQLRQLTSLNATFLGRVTTVSIGGYIGRSTQLLREDSPYVPSPTTNADNRQEGFSVDLSRRTSGVTTLSARLSKSRIEGIGVRDGDVSSETSLTLTVNYALGPKTTLAGGVRHRAFDSNVNSSSRENAVFLGTTHRF